MQLRGRTAPPAVATIIASDADAKRIDDRIEEHSRILAEARAIVAQTEAEHDTLLIDQALGQKIDQRTIDRVAAHIADEQRTIDQQQRIIDGLRARLAAWRAKEAERRYHDNRARMQAASDAASELEKEYSETATRLVHLAQQLNAVRNEYTQAVFAAGRYEHDRGLSAPRPRTPGTPFAIPDAYIQRADYILPWERWLNERERVHHFNDSEKGR